MQKTSKMKLKRFIALAINLQFILPTSGFAKGNVLGTVMDAVGTVGGAYTQQMQQMQMQQMSQMQRQQLSSQFGIQQVDPNQVPPLFTQNGCIVIKARSNTSADMCDPNKYDPQKAQMGYYTALQEVAENNSNELENFLTPGNQRFTTQGVGCFDKSVTQFNAQLKARMEALNKLEQDIESQVKAFKKLAEKDLEDIKKGQALLTGKPAAYLRDFKFEDQFKDKQCASIFRKDTFKTTGEKKGFLAIQTLLDGEVSPKQGMGPSDLIAKTADIKKDIRKIASRAAKYAQDSDSLNVSPENLNLRTSQISPDNASLKAILADTQSAADQEAKSLQKDLLAVVGQEEQLAKLIPSIDSADIDLDSALFDFERSKKNECLTNYVKSNFGSADGFANNLEDPTVSKKLNKEGDSYFKNSVSAILNDSDYTIEEKLARIKKADGESNRYTFKTGKSMNIKGKRIGASTRLRASDMIEIFADNCVERFDKQRVTNGKSYKTMIQSLKKYKSNRAQLQAKFITKMKNDIITQMETCPSDTSTGSAENSCQGALNTNGKNFCVRTANLCSNNMLACQDKANKIVDKTRLEQKKLGDRYKQNMEGLKKKMAQQFVVANAAMEASARQLDGMYQVGTVFKAPVDLKLDMLTNKFMKGEGYDPALQLEDPDVYLKLVKDDIKNLKKQVEDNHRELMNGDPSSGAKFNGVLGEVKKYKENMANEKKLWNKSANDCLALINRYNKETSDAIAKENEATDEYNKKLVTACRKIDDFNEHPAGFCGKTSELADEVADITSSVDQVAVKNIGAFERVCDAYGSQSGNTHDSTGSNSTKTVKGTSIDKFCKANGDFPACTRLVAIHKDNLSQICIKGKPVDIKKDSPEFTQFAKNNLKKDGFCTGINDDISPKLNSGEACNDLGRYNPIKSDEDAIPHISAYYTKVLGDEQLTKDFYKVSNTSNECKRDISDDDESLIAVDMIKAQQKVELEQSMLSDMGGVSIAACNATMDNGVGKSLMQLGEQGGRALAGNNPFAFGM